MSPKSAKTNRFILAASSACKSSLTLLIFSGCAATEMREDYYPGGALKSRSTVLVSPEGNLTPHGRFTAWFKSGGKMQEGRLLNGQTQGAWTTWYESGEKESRRQYADGRLDGAITEWFKNGAPRFETHFAKGQKHGAETIWYPNGQKQWEGAFEDGKLMRFKSYDGAGRVTSEYDRKRGFGTPDGRNPPPGPRH